MAALSRVRKAVIPVAGLGTRLFPASTAVKKELFPVVGPDGIARAMLHYHLMELSAAGIDEICIIVQPGDEAAIRAYLAGPPADYERRLEKFPALVQEAERMRSLAKCLRFAVQSEQEGYGHAVYQTRDFCAGEPVLLCLGDHLFRGRAVSPYRELADQLASAGGRSVSAVNRLGAAELKGYGTIAGKRRPSAPRLIDVSLIVEKPSVETARERLHVDGLPPDTWLGWFGMHLLAPSIYEVLAEMIRDNVRDRGEIQLTRAQEIQRQREGYLAFEMIAAQRFDFGTADDYLSSLQAFRRNQGPPTLGG
jgi:UTP--glucose-1-phosphate uridylyltransferase